MQLTINHMEFYNHLKGASKCAHKDEHRFIIHDVHCRIDYQNQKMIIESTNSYIAYKGIMEIDTSGANTNGAMTEFFIKKDFIKTLPKLKKNEIYSKMSIILTDDEIIFHTTKGNFSFKIEESQHNKYPDMDKLYKDYDNSHTFRVDAKLLKDVIEGLDYVTFTVDTSNGLNAIYITNNDKSVNNILLPVKIR